MKHLLITIAALAFSWHVHSANAQQVDGKPLRIIALAPHIVENLYHIGAGDMIVGTTEHADFPSDAEKIPRIGNYAKLNIEAILAVQPDLIIAWKSGNPSDDIARLKQLGIKVVYSQPNSLKDVADELRFFGELAGKKEQAQEKAVAFEQSLEKIKAKYLNSKRVKAFYELWSRPLTTVAGNAWPQHMLAVCNVDNPFVNSATDYPQINVEDVVLAMPDVIIQPSAHSHTSPDTVNWKQWAEMPAVKNNAFIHPDADRIHRMTTRSLDELTSLCQQLDNYR